MEEEKSNFTRGVIYGGLVGALSALVWYGVVTFTQYQFGWLAILIGWLVGAATAMGSGKGGPQVAVASLAIAAISLITGTYWINDHFYRMFTTQELRAEAAFQDGEISDEDLALYFETSVGQLRSDLAEEGMTMDDLREIVREEMEYEVEANSTEYQPPPAEHLPLSELPLWMGLWEYIFIGIGAYQAFRVPLSPGAP